MAIREAYIAGEIIRVQMKDDEINVLVEGYSQTYDLIIRIWVSLTKNMITTAYPVYGGK